MYEREVFLVCLCVRVIVGCLWGWVVRGLGCGEEAWVCCECDAVG